MTNQGVVDIFE